MDEASKVALYAVACAAGVTREAGWQLVDDVAATTTDLRAAADEVYRRADAKAWGGGAAGSPHPALGKP